MKLYLLRHGHSPAASECAARSDAERPLSAKGRADALEAARELLKRGGRPAVILHSPLLRAEQTAAAAAEVLQPARGRRVFAPLANALPAPELYAALAAPLSEGEVLAVGHQPQLGDLTCHLCREMVDLKPAGLIALDVSPDGKATLLWSRNP